MAIAENFGFKAIGRVRMFDAVTNELLRTEFNAIHPQHVARIFARALAHEQNSFIHQMALGNGGTHIDATQQIRYMPPNTEGAGASLYNQTYSEIVDDTHIEVGAGNSVVSSDAPSPSLASIVTVTMTLAENEPNGQAGNDNTTTDPDSQFTFDEMGLLTADTPPLLLTHLTFSPFEKTANRAIVIVYDITVTAS